MTGLRSSIDFGDFRRTTPVSRYWGFDRGVPIDRYYIARFLQRHAGDVAGRVLEIGDNSYTRRFGEDRVERSDVLHVEDSATATIVADLASSDPVPLGAFDCAIVTQTLHLIYDVPAAVRRLHDMLVPGGVVLATVPGITPVDADEWRDRWAWSFTPMSVRRRFEEAFPPRSVSVEAFGNVLAASAFLFGLAAEELAASELDVYDPRYPVTIAIRAERSA